MILVSVRFDKVRQVCRVVVRWFYGLLRCVRLGHDLVRQVRQVWVRWDKLGFGMARFGKAGPVRCVCVRRVVLRQAPFR